MVDWIKIDREHALKNSSAQNSHPVHIFATSITKEGKGGNC